ncbi:hypothetical protein Celaphus_00010058 [Cervus elaphus hippelaphus]|uniref:60S ribosomal protein L13a n=1 Tax=Cervus elaphus hippelaphus TaxID=46360 RepID=A0A212C049_CEREH|nr:hypothetical protein Celaphus_00010058 [Cervus elaphus hippelaphus]
MAEGQVLVLDGRGHLLGCPEAIMAKQVLLGQKTVVVCCEGINMSANFYRNKLNRIFWQTVQGMPPHKTKRGQGALECLEVSDGISRLYDKKKRMVVPAALKVVCLKLTQKFAHLGHLAHEVGWKYQVVNGHTGGEEKGKSQDPLSEKEAAHKATEAG